MFKKKNMKSTDSSLNKVFRMKSNDFFLKKRWVWQVIICCILFIFITGSIYLKLPGSSLLKDYLSYYLHEEKSDWTPAIKAMVNYGLWLDSFDRNVYEDSKEVTDSTSLTLPVSGRFTKEFGWVNSPVDKEKTFHSGIDIEASIGDPIRAALEGEVVNIWSDDKMGRVIEIKHNNNLTTLYGNCSEILVKVGEKVKTGQIIGKVGKGINNGMLHFEVRKNGEPINPLTVLDPTEKSEI